MSETKTIKDTLGDRVREVREARGLSLREMSGRLSGIDHTIDHAGLMRLEKGGRRATVDDLIAICVVLDVTPDALVVPIRDGEKVRLPGLGDRQVDRVRDWWCGRLLMLPTPRKSSESEDWLYEEMERKQRWLSQRPLYEQRALQHDGMATLMAETHRLARAVGGSAETGANPAPGESRRALEAIKAAVDLLMTEVE